MPAESACIACKVVYWIHAGAKRALIIRGNWLGFLSPTSVEGALIAWLTFHLLKVQWNSPVRKIAEQDSLCRPEHCSYGTFFFFQIRVRSQKNLIFFFLRTEATLQALRWQDKQACLWQKCLVANASCVILSSWSEFLAVNWRMFLRFCRWCCHVPPSVSSLLPPLMCHKTRFWDFSRFATHFRASSVSGSWGTNNYS